jgi:hypothetical protein
MPRIFLTIAALVAFAVVGPSTVTLAAQDASPAASGSLLAALGYPELRITVTEDGVEAPTEVPAGRYLLIVENTTETQGADVNIMQPPPGMTVADIMASPEPEDRAPDWIYDATFAGGFDAAPGTSGQVVLDLEAGEWFIEASFYSDEEEGDEAEASPAADEASDQPLTLTVTGEAPPVEDPADAVATEMQEFAFLLPSPIAAGPQIWKVTNTGDQPHFLFILKGPDDLTMDQVMTLLSLDPESGATPPPGTPGFEEFAEDIGGTGVLSTGRTNWIELDLAPGTYVALCFITDPNTGAPHALMGMANIFTVG